MKSLTLHYPNFLQNLELRTSFQVNKIARALTTAKTDELIEFENGKCNKISVKLNGVYAVTSNEWEQGCNPYILQLVFQDGKEFKIPIWGEKRARNSFYAFSELLMAKADQKFYKILQTGKKDFSLLQFYSDLQFVKLLDPELQDLSENIQKGQHEASSAV